MMDFEQYMARHGEASAQAIIERLERYEGVRPRWGLSLEERWNMLMQESEPFQRRRLAA